MPDTSPPDPDDFGFVAGMVLKKIRSTLTDELADEDPEVLQKYILTDYDLVAKETPESVRETIEGKGEHFSHLFDQFVHPEYVYGWLANPEWAPSEEIRENLRECADIIDVTPGAAEWLTKQVYSVWVMAGIDPPVDPDADLDADSAFDTGADED